MRKTAMLPTPVDHIVRVMLYAKTDGAYLFLYTRAEDGPSDFDEWYDSLADAERAAAERFGIHCGDWAPIDDPLPGGQSDWVCPTRVKRDAAGNRQWGQFEAMPPGEREGETG
jgi:hypothetical protein